MQSIGTFNTLFLLLVTLDTKLTSTLTLWVLSGWLYTFLLFCGADDLPIRGFIGHLEEVSILPHEHRTYLWTHLHFTFEYNGDQVGSNWTYYALMQCIKPGLLNFSYFYMCILKCKCTVQISLTITIPTHFRDDDTGCNQSPGWGKEGVVKHV